MKLLTGEIIIFQDTGALTVLLSRVTKAALSQGYGISVGSPLDSRQVNILLHLMEVVTSRIPMDDIPYGFNKIFLENYLCYSETPVYRWVSGTQKRLVVKELLTSNLDVVSDFIGEDRGYVSKKYGSHLKPPQGTKVSYFRLTQDRDGTRKVVRPRSQLDISDLNLRLIPWTVILAELEFLVEKSLVVPVKVVYQKDNGEVRDLTFTLNKDIYNNIYGDTEPYDNIDLDRSLHRGYVRVPELGAPRYNDRLKSINLARVFQVSEDSSPDLRFIDIDLDNIVNTFVELSGNVGEELVIARLIECGWNLDISNMNLYSWASNAQSIYTVMFQRSLADFMINNPDMFPGYPWSKKLPEPTVSQDIDMSDPMSFLINF